MMGVYMLLSLGMVGGLGCGVFCFRLCGVLSLLMRNGLNCRRCRDQCNTR